MHNVILAFICTHTKPKDFLQKEIRFDMITQLRMLKFFVSKKNSETSMNLLPEQIHLSSFLTYILGCRDFKMGASRNIYFKSLQFLFKEHLIGLSGSSAVYSVKSSSFKNVSISQFCIW